MRGWANGRSQTSRHWSWGAGEGCSDRYEILCDRNSGAREVTTDAAHFRQRYSTPSSASRAQASWFRAFYSENYARVLATSQRRVPSRAAAEDVASEVFLLVWQKVVAGGAPTASWAFAALRNIVGNEYRRDAQRLRLANRIRSELCWSGDESTSDVAIAMKGIPTSDRELLFLKYWIGQAGRR